MTLIVGIRCTDGVVVGTDSAMTFGSGQDFHTIEQPLRQKIDIIGDRVIVAGTGQFGLGQRFVDIVKRHWTKKELRTDNIVDVGRILAKSAVEDFASTKVAQGSYGALVALPCGQEAELVGFCNFQPEVKTKDYWYASMGSGQLVADPLLGFMRTAFWGDEPPNRQDGIFAATMVLKLGCEMAPEGVAEPIQMAVLSLDRDNKGKLSARRLEEGELDEHRGNVEDAIKYFGKYRNILHDRSAPKPPDAPSD